MKNANYALEHEDEFDRLERQSRLPPYDPETDLRGFAPPEGAPILDAGCGSGVVTRLIHARFPKSTVVGCDRSVARMERADATAGARDDDLLRFEAQELDRLTYPTGAFGGIFCRYVLEHQPSDRLSGVVRELCRALRPGGEIRLVDVDGFWENLHPLSPALAARFARIRESGRIDFFVGRKLSGSLRENGLENIRTRIVTHHFADESLREERETTRERLALARPFLAETLGSDAEATAFSEGLLEHLDRPGCVLFYNKFIVDGTKPTTGLAVVGPGRSRAAGS